MIYSEFFIINNSKNDVYHFDLHIEGHTFNFINWSMNAGSVRKHWKLTMTIRNTTSDVQKLTKCLIEMIW